MKSDRTDTSTSEAQSPSGPVLLGPERAGRKRRIWPWIVVLAVAALGLFLLLRGGGKEAAAAAKAKAAVRTVPVTAVAARLGDVPVYLTGLGTVTALNTVTVRSRVDGELINVAYREGQAVQQGDLLAEIDPRPFQVQLMQAEGQLAKDEAALKNAQIDLERYRVLMSQDAIPRQQLDTQVSTVNQFQASLQSDRSQIESAKLNLTYSRIKAPIPGRVGLRLVDPGNIVHASDPNGVVVITQIQPIAVVFTVPADQLPKVMQQLRGGKKLVVEAFDRDLKNKLATGGLTAVDNQIDQTTGTVRLKALFSNEDGALFPNQFVNARLLVDTLKQTTLVPAAAVQRSAQSSFVYLVKPDETVEVRTVDVQLTEGDDTAIRKGLQPGDLVVTDGIDKLQAGAKVSLGKSEGKSEGKTDGKVEGKSGKKAAS